MITPPDPERFGQLLREKIEELDAADSEELALLSDEVERLRLDAAVLATKGESRKWVVGAIGHYQADQVALGEQKPTLDLRFPAGRSVPKTGTE